MTDELKPCPFCGQTDKLEFQSWIDQSGEYSEKYEVVFCNNHTVSAHLDIWQTRPIEDALRAENERLRAAIQTAFTILGKSPLSHANVQEAMDDLFHALEVKP